jgi:hypothetical protein
VESFFAFVDKSVVGCNGAHIRNRLEVSKARMNHLYDFLLSFTSEKRLSIVAKAYANATVNRKNVLKEEEEIKEYHLVTDESRNLMASISDV